MGTLKVFTSVQIRGPSVFVEIEFESRFGSKYIIWTTIPDGPVLYYQRLRTLNVIGISNLESFTLVSARLSNLNFKLETSAKLEIIRVWKSIELNVANFIKKLKKNYENFFYDPLSILNFHLSRTFYQPTSKCNGNFKN